MPAKKKAKGAAQRPVKARSRKRQAKVPVRRPRASSSPSRPPRAMIGSGSVPMQAGRIRWQCWPVKGGVDIRFEPSGVRSDIRRVSLEMAFKTSPSGAASGDFMPTVDDRLVSLQFQTYPGWNKGFSIQVQGVDHAPIIS